jgi:hypothetical protein
MQSMQALLDLEPSSSNTVQQHALKACLAVLLATTRAPDAEVKQVQATARHINVLDTLGRASTSLQYMTGMPTEVLLLLTAKQHKALLRKASKPADLRSNTQAVQHQSLQMQQREAAAAAAAASSAGFNQSSALLAAADASAAATAAAFAEQMADEVPQPETPGIDGSSSGSPFGLAPGKGYPGSSGSNMPAAANSYFGAGQYSASEQLDLSGGSNRDCFSNSSSKAAGFDWRGQYDSNKTWQQWKQQPLFGDGAADTASLPVFGGSSSSNTAAATSADGGDVLEVDTVPRLASSGSSSCPAYSSSQAVRNWGSQDDTGLPEQRSSSSGWQQAYPKHLYRIAAYNSTPAAGMPRLCLADYASFSMHESSKNTAAAGPAADNDAPVHQPDTPIAFPSSTAFGGTASRLAVWAPDSAWHHQQDSSLFEQPGSSSNTGSSFAAASSNNWQQAWQGPLFGSGFNDCTTAAAVSEYVSNAAAAPGLAAGDIALVHQPDTPVTLPSSTAFGGTASRLPSGAPDSFWHHQQDSSLFEQLSSSSNTGSSFAAASSNNWQQAWQGPLFGSGFDDCTTAAAVSERTSCNEFGSNTTAACSAVPAADDDAPVHHPYTPVTPPRSTAFGGTARRLFFRAPCSAWRQQHWRDSSVPEQQGSSSTSSSIPAPRSASVSCTGFPVHLVAMLLKAWVGSPTQLSRQQAAAALPVWSCAVHMLPHPVVLSQQQHLQRL